MLKALEILATSKHKSSVLVMEIGACLELLVVCRCPSTSIPTRYIKSPLASSGAIGFHDSVTEGVSSGSISLEGTALIFSGAAAGAVQENKGNNVHHKEKDIDWLTYVLQRLY